MFEVHHAAGAPYYAVRLGIGDGTTTAAHDGCTVSL